MTEPQNISICINIHMCTCKYDLFNITGFIKIINKETIRESMIKNCLKC